MEDLSSQLAAASFGRPRAFAQAVCDLLMQRFGLAAASIYLHSVRDAPLRLKAAAGFDYDLYDHFELSWESFAGEAVRENRVVTAGNVSESPQFKNKRLLTKTPLGGVAASPLPQVQDATNPFFGGIPSPIGVVNLYPKSAEDLDELATWLRAYVPFLSRLYLATLELQAMDMRRATVSGAAFKRDHSSVSHAFLELITKELDVGASALWILNPRRERLFLRQAVGPQVRRNRPRDDPGIVMSADHLLLDVFRSESPVRLNDGVSPDLIPRDMVAKSQLRNGLLVPVRLPESTKLRSRVYPSLGVLGLFDHRTDLGGTAHPTAFTWEDELLASFGCQMLSVLLFQIFRIRDHESDFERLLHGARNIVSGAKRNLDAIANSIDTDTLPPGEKYYLTDASYWLDDLQAQIDRNERTREPKQIPVAPINLYGQVLSKFAPLAKRRAAWEQAAFDGLVGADKMSEEYRTWPPVLGDVTAIETVFRNLLDNSVKYRRSETLDIAMEVQVDEGAGILRVHYEDGGIGVPDGDRGVAFEDGFRGAAALARAPVGLGSGLAESLQLLNAIGGQIYLSDRQSRFGQGSVFVVEMRIAKRQRRYR